MYLLVVSTHKLDCGVAHKACLLSGYTLPVIKSSYNTYTHCASQNAPNHSHITALIKDVLDPNDAVLFTMHKKQLRATCAVCTDSAQHISAYSTKPLTFVDSLVCGKLTDVTLQRLHLGQYSTAS